MALSTDQYGYLIDPLVPITDDKGTTIKDGFIRVYIAGSSTPVITYRNYDGAANEKTIEIDNSGRCKYPIIVRKSLAYKVVVYDAQHSQETPIITIDKMFAIGASVTAGAGATVVTGLDGLTTKPDGFVDASVIGTDGYVALDHTLVEDELDTDAKVTAVENDRYIPLLNEDVNDPDSKMTLKRLKQWVHSDIFEEVNDLTEASDFNADDELLVVSPNSTRKMLWTTLANKVLGFIKSLSTTITAFRTGDVIPVDGPSGTAKMGKDDLLRETAENALGSIHSLSDTATEADLVSGNYLAMDGNNGTKKAPSDLFAKSSEVGKNVSVAGTLATTYDYHIVRVRGKIGDVVSLDYTASQSSNLVVTPEGGSASVLILQAKSGHYDYVLTSSSADFGIFGAVGVDYTLSAKSGLKLDIDAVANNFSNFKKSNIKTVYSGTLASAYDYKIAYVEGNIGDKVRINYTTSASSNLVVIPQGGSATILKNGGTGGSVEYTMTASSATFGVFGNVGMTYSITIAAGLAYAIEKTNAFAQEVDERLSLDESSNLKKTYSGSLESVSDYKIAYVEGNIGDKVYIDYTTSASSNFVAFPVGGSPTIIVNGGTGKKLEYTLTSAKVSFGVFGNVGMTYSITIEAGLSYQIKTTRHELGNVDVYTGTISSYNYNIAKIEGNIGEKVLIKFETSAGVNFVIGHTAVRSGTFGWYEYTLTSASIGVGFYVTEETTYTLEIRRGVAGNVASLMESTSVLKTKNLLVLGDSISTSPYYYKYLMKEFSACRNIAVVSATWADRNNTDSYDGNSTQDVAKGNVMGNQVQKIKNTPSLLSFEPDVILLAAGTNDSDSTGATLNESLFTDSNGFVSLGTPTFDSADTYMANRRTMAGAMRYCITELEKIYPNAQIFICTPIQSSQSIHQYVNTKNKQELQKAVGQRMSVNVIDVGGCCGIYGDFEYLGSCWTEQEPDSHAGRDLYDGLHPNNSGSQKMAKYIYNEILRILKK